MILLSFAILIKHFILIQAEDKYCKSNNTEYFASFIGVRLCRFHNFDTFNDIKNCNITYNIKPYLQIIPKNEILIDYNFDIYSILGDKDLKNLDTLEMINFKGIDLNANNIFSIFKRFSFSFVYSKLNFYFNNRLLQPADCTYDSFRTKTTFFSNFNSLTFYFVKYTEDLCPYVFNQVFAHRISILDITNSFLNKNSLSFLKLNATEYSKENNIVIKNLVLSLKYEALTARIMDKYAFRNVFELRITGFLNGIQTDLFSYFIALKNIDLRVDNFKDFFHKGNKWMIYLNSKWKIKNMDNYNEFVTYRKNFLTIRFEYRKVLTLINQIYEYPNEDFCLFHHFPHDQINLPMIVPGKRIECSCTLLYLIQYYEYYININYTANTSIYQDSYYYGNLEDTDASYTILYCHDKHLEHKLKDCNFDTRIKFCKKDDFLIDSYDSSFNLNNNIDLLFLFKWLQFVFSIVLQPILSTLGIINNLLTILVIKNKTKRKNFKDPMYTHIFINSIFNILYCFITEFKLINECLFFTSSVFCSSVYQTEPAQYFKIIFIEYLGNVFKYCKNVSFISFCLSRYILSLNKTKGFYGYFKKINLKLYVFLLVVVSALLSIYKLFEYKVVESHDPEFNFPNETFNNTSCNLNYYSSCRLFIIIKLINTFLNDILTFILVLIIDILLINDYGKYLNGKKKINGNKGQNDEEYKIKKKKITRMVIINGLFYVIFYFPEFISTLVMSIFSIKVYEFVDYNLEINILPEVAQTLNLISISFQFYIFICFNNNFNDSFSFLVRKFIPNYANAKIVRTDGIK